MPNFLRSRPDVDAHVRNPSVVKKSPPALDSADLFVGGVEVLIRHDGAVYRLRATSQNKLILTK